MIGDLDALLVLSLACGIAGVAVLVCGMGAVRDFMYGRHLDGDVDDTDVQAEPVDPSTLEEPRAWVRVIEADVTPTPARRISTRSDEEVEPVHTGGRGLLERLLSGIAAIPDVADEPDSDPVRLEAAAAAASAVATSHAKAPAEADGAAVAPLLPEWVPPTMPAASTVGATRGIHRLAAALDADPGDDTFDDQPLEVSVEGPARLAVARGGDSLRQARPSAPSAVEPAPMVRTPVAPAAVEAPAPEELEPAAVEPAALEPAAESGIGQLAALIDLNESRRTRRRGKGHRAGFRRASDESAEDGPTRRKLPVGAERALLSIIEVQPDPRNVLALQRDPTAQVTITEVDRAAAAAAFARDRDEEAASRRRHPTAHRRSA